MGSKRPQVTETSGPLKRRQHEEPYVAVTLDDVLPVFGEGLTRAEAMADMIDTIAGLYEAMRDEPNAGLSLHLQEQRDFLVNLEYRLRKARESDTARPWREAAKRAGPLTVGRPPNMPSAETIRTVRRMLDELAAAQPTSEE